MELERNIVIENKYGLHARPALLIVDTASKFDSEVKLLKENKTADAKSIMEVMMLAAEKGSEIVIKARGKDAQKAVEALAQLFAEHFNEE